MHTIHSTLTEAEKWYFDLPNLRAGDPCLMKLNKIIR